MRPFLKTGENSQRTVMPFRKLYLLILPMVLLLVSMEMVLADDAAQTAYDNGQYEQAVKLWRKHANNDDTEAQNRLGELYRKGHGVERNYKKAAQWFRRAARLGDAEAQFNLGALYRVGKGVKKDSGLAAQWYERAAKKGYAAAQYSFGLMLENGRGVERDRAAAREWYIKAAAQDHHKAAKRLKALKQDSKKRIIGDPAEALRRAARSGDLKSVQRFIKYANKAAGEQGNTPLMLAAGKNHHAIVAALLSAGAKVDARNKQKETALLLTSKAGALESVSLLLKAGARVASPDSFKRTPLMVAVDKNHSAVIRRLLKAGADPDRRDKRGESAFSRAVKSGKPELASNNVTTVEYRC